MHPILVLMRPHQWVKNVFVGAPLFFTPSALSAGTAARAVLGIACFSALASAMYVLNDWCDRDADRQHPVKKLRPLATGEVSATAALMLALAKRRDDIVRKIDEGHRRSLAGYNAPFLDTAVSVVLGALLVCYLLYTTQPDNMARLHSDKLYLTAPFVIAGVLRYLQITIVEHRSGSPTRLALSDRFLMLTIVGWIVTFGLLIYG